MQVSINDGAYGGIVGTSPERPKARRLGGQTKLYYGFYGENVSRVSIGSTFYDVAYRVRMKSNL